jgi:hypothetical protein
LRGLFFLLLAVDLQDAHQQNDGQKGYDSSYHRYFLLSDLLKTVEFIRNDQFARHKAIDHGRSIRAAQSD